MKDALANAAEIVKAHFPGIVFNLMEIGVRPAEAIADDAFFQLVPLFPGSRLIAFEPEPFPRKQKQKQAPAGVEYHGLRISNRTGEQELYETVHPACASVLEPNWPLLSEYRDMRVAEIQSVTTVSTTSLDDFIAAEGIADLDFIRIDAQGDEVGVFRNGASGLKDAVCVASRANFIEMNKGQPLFGDLAAFMGGQGFMFHKFLGVGGRLLEPVAAGVASQAMWCEALFIPGLDRLEGLPAPLQVKLGLLAITFQSLDLAYRCFSLAAREKEEFDLHRKLPGMV